MLLRTCQTANARTGLGEVVGFETRCKYIPVSPVANIPVGDGLRTNYLSRTPRRTSARWICLLIPLGALTYFSYAAFMREFTDEQLMRRYTNGDAKAFDELYDRHRGPLYRYFNRQVSDVATANDLYQGTWEKIIKSRRKYRPAAPFTAWMYQIAHNHLVDHYRRTRPAEPFEADTLADEHSNPSQDMVDGEQREKLRMGIIALPAEQRDTLLLQLETGLKLEDIAMVTGVSRETVKSRLRYAVNKLKQVLIE